jgi:tryptophan-rich hypothetical protein
LNKFNPKKLLHSKWTAVKPMNKEKHFMVTDAVYDEHGEVELCKIEAVYSNRQQSIDWLMLKDDKQWLQGWQ